MTGRVSELIEDYINYYYVYAVSLIVHCSFTSFSFPVCLLSRKMPPHFDVNVFTHFYYCTLFLLIVHYHCFVMQLCNLDLVFIACSYYVIDVLLCCVFGVHLFKTR